MTKRVHIRRLSVVAFLATMLVSTSSFSGISNRIYIDAIYDETDTENDPNLKGLDLLLAQFGFQSCMPMTRSVSRQKTILKNSSGAFFIEDAEIYRQDTCASRARLSAYLVSVNDIKKIVRANGGNCYSQRDQEVCEHAILIERTPRNFYTGYQTANKYTLLLAFKYSAPKNALRRSLDTPNVQWFQANLSVP